MKAPTKGNHPCPILLEDGGDYIGNCSFTASIEGQGSSSGEGHDLMVEYPISVSVNCPPLIRLIDEGLAKIVLFVEQATYRQSFDYFEGFKLQIHPFDFKLGDNVEITPIIIATQPACLDYDQGCMDKIYSMFESKTFQLEKGQILGYGQVIEIKTNQYKGLSSILSLREADGVGMVCPFNLDLDNEKIILQVHRDIFEKVKIIQGALVSLSPMVNAVIVYPTIYMTIESMIRHHDKYASYKWFVAIKNKLNEIRLAKREPPFLPDEPFVENEEQTLEEYVWELTSELLTNGQGQGEPGQMMVNAFIDAAKTLD